MEFVQKILTLLGGLSGLLFSLPEFRYLKILISFIAILISLILILYWIYLERKYKYGIEWWKFLIKYFSEAFIKPEYFDEEWLKIKNVFLSDYLNSLIRTYKYLEEVIELYGYEEKSLLEKFKKIPEQVFPNKERFLKALEALGLIYRKLLSLESKISEIESLLNNKDIKEKLEKGSSLEISENEALAILKEIELGLQGLFVITHKALWANFLVLPSNK